MFIDAELLLIEFLFKIVHYFLNIITQIFAYSNFITLSIFLNTLLFQYLSLSIIQIYFTIFIIRIFPHQQFLPFNFPSQIKIIKHSFKLFTFPYSFNPPPIFEGVLDNQINNHQLTIIKMKSNTLFHRYRASIRFTVFHYLLIQREKRHWTVPNPLSFRNWGLERMHTHTHMHAFLSREAANRVTVTRLYRILIEKRDRVA